MLKYYLQLKITCPVFCWISCPMFNFGMLFHCSFFQFSTSEFCDAYNLGCPIVALDPIKKGISCRMINTILVKILWALILVIANKSEFDDFLFLLCWTTMAYHSDDEISVDLFILRPIFRYFDVCKKHGILPNKAILAELFKVYHPYFILFVYMRFVMAWMNLQHITVFVSLESLWNYSMGYT